MRCRCAASRRWPGTPPAATRPAPAAPNSLPPASPRITPGGRAGPPRAERAPSPKSVPSTANFRGSPSARCSLRQPRERCAPSRATLPLPTRHPWDPLPSAAPLGARSSRRVAQERSETLRGGSLTLRAPDCCEPLKGKHLYLRVSSPLVVVSFPPPQIPVCRDAGQTPESWVSCTYPGIGSGKKNTLVPQPDCLLY